MLRYVVIDHVKRLWPVCGFAFAVATILGTRRFNLLAMPPDIVGLTSPILLVVACYFFQALATERGGSFSREFLRVQQVLPLSKKSFIRAFWVSIFALPFSLTIIGYLTGVAFQVLSSGTLIGAHWLFTILLAAFVMPAFYLCMLYRPRLPLTAREILICACAWTPLCIAIWWPLLYCTSCILTLTETNSPLPQDAAESAPLILRLAMAPPSAIALTAGGLSIPFLIASFLFTPSLIQRILRPSQVAPPSSSKAVRIQDKRKILFLAPETRILALGLAITAACSVFLSALLRSAPSSFDSQDLVLDPSLILMPAVLTLILGCFVMFPLAYSALPWFASMRAFASLPLSSRQRAQLSRRIVMACSASLAALIIVAHPLYPLGLLSYLYYANFILIVNALGMIAVRGIWKGRPTELKGHIAQAKTTIGFTLLAGLILISPVEIALLAGVEQTRWVCLVLGVLGFAAAFILNRRIFARLEDDLRTTSEPYRPRDLKDLGLGV